MRFGSVCSGIEAASVAWGALGWKAAWLSEIEPFPSAVLAHHYPDIPNLGDMTTLPARIRAQEIEAPDVFCGGTPCQAFSVAGKRQSLDDARGNLSLTFCKIANEIDATRSVRGEQPAIIFWENVPGVLNTKDNAFGCFLGELAGEVCELQPAGGKWTNAGCVFGPQRTVAWRVLDAQYFGVAQRRRRVFVVASARTDFDPVAVLFEFDGVRRDAAPRRESREIAPTIPARSTGGGGLGTDFDLDGGVITMAHGQGGAEIGFDRGPTSTCNHEAPIAVFQRAAGTGVKYAHYSHDYAHDRITDTSGVNPSLTREAHASGNLNIAQPIAFPANLSGTQYASTEDLSPSMGAANPTAVAFAQNSRDEVRLMNGDGRIVGALAAEPGMKQTCYVAQPIAYTTKLHNTASNNAGKFFEEYSTCLDANSPPPAVFAPAVCPTLRAGGNSTGGDRPPGTDVDTADSNIVMPGMQVRRLTPIECERLQGFPDNYTAIPWRKKPATDCPDGPRYKALGNSWAVPNVRWIGQRIQNALTPPQQHQAAA